MNKSTPPNAVADKISFPIAKQKRVQLFFIVFLSQHMDMVLLLFATLSSSNVAATFNRKLRKPCTRLFANMIQFWDQQRQKTCFSPPCPSTSAPHRHHLPFQFQNVLFKSLFCDLKPCPNKSNKTVKRMSTNVFFLQQPWLVRRKRNHKAVRILIS